MEETEILENQNVTQADKMKPASAHGEHKELYLLNVWSKNPGGTAPNAVSVAATMCKLIAEQRRMLEFQKSDDIGTTRKYCGKLKYF